MSNAENPVALLIAFHFPPLQGSSGMQRTLGYARHLPSTGWTPIVLTPNSKAYQDIDPRQATLIPENLYVQRSFCLDSARHLAWRGRYLGSLAVPDRWISWVPGAVINGLNMIRRHRPKVIWSTYPIATAHIVGRTLARLTGIPWVADFRDPMVESDSRTGEMFPADPRVRKARLSIERSCVKYASALVFCTVQARDICLNRYPELDADRSHVIANGYEEHAFQLAAGRLHSKKADRTTGQHPLTLLHSGTIYPTADRDPRPFFDAVAALKQSGAISATTAQIKLRATGHDDVIGAALKERNIGDIVTLHPPLPYTDALAEILEADGLLLFQGYTSNPAIPAKLYEYLRANRPLLALVDPHGSTAELLNDLQTGVQSPIEDVEATRIIFQRFLDDVRNQKCTPVNTEEVQRFSRQSLSGELAMLFNTLNGDGR